MSRSLYFIAVLPPQALRTQVRLLKEEMQRRFGAGHALKSPAHITLQMPFRCHEDRQEILMRLLEDTSKKQSAFEVLLRGFDCFPPRVIFIRVRDHQPFRPLQAALKAALTEAEIIPERTVPHPFHPHMTIATRDLDPASFEIAWAEFQDRSFEEVFEARGVALLKHNGKHWDILQEFRFG